MIQLEAVIQSRFPGLGAQPEALIRPMLSLLRKLLREEEVNAFLRQAGGVGGLEFIDRVLDYFNVSYSVVGREIERIPAEGRVVIVANHPLGMLDGVALLKLVGQVRRDVRIVANDVLMQFRPLRPLLLPVVNMGGGFNRANIEAIHAALDADQAVIIFPSGEVSRAGPRGIRDGRWQSGFLRLAERARAPLLPVHVGGRNSLLFYGVSTLCRPLSTLMLLREPHRQRNVTLPIRIGTLMPWRDIASLDLPREAIVRRISQEVYRLAARGTPRGGRVVALRPPLPVAHPEDRVTLRRELQAARLLGSAGEGRQIFLFDAAEDCAVLRELGRLREIAFRQVGEGTGKRRDVDAFDAYYRHVVLWDDANLQIIGAYRLAEAGDVLEQRGVRGLYTHGLFDFSVETMRMLPQALELGRSFIQPRYQGLRALDCLWHGIGAYLATRPDVRYLFGPVSISASYPEEARRLLIYFFRRHFSPARSRASARMPAALAQTDTDSLACVFNGTDYATDLRTLKQRLSAMGLSIPTLYKQYAELCEPGGTEFLAFGIDPAFSNCIDGLVWVDLDRLKPGKRERYLGAFLQPISGTLLKSA